jgi:REP element-mobilizing transposase RayT
MTRSSTMHSRLSLRLRGYDYAMAGAYFVTICTQDRACLFGDVVAGAMCLNEAGQMVAALWDGIAARFPGVEIDQFVVMPNHLHGILVLPDAGVTTRVATGATTRVAPTDPAIVGAPLVGAPLAPARLSDVVGAFKSLATVGYISGVRAKGWPEFRGRLWQRNYYEHVIRNETALDRIRRYVDDNPAHWEFDDENPRKTRP